MFKAIRMFFSARMQYLQLYGAAPEEKEKSTRLGVQSIILAVIGIVIVIAGVVLGSLCAHQVTMAINGSE